uniref:Uncharacterized protein n=1 Tax=mine drainage metagenome TaxID=410659 RepID=E6QDL5_9ZZZZ
MRPQIAWGCCAITRRKTLTTASGLRPRMRRRLLKYLQQNGAFWAVSLPVLQGCKTRPGFFPGKDQKIICKEPCGERRQ